MKCRGCKNENLKEIISLGETPLANSFLSEADLEKKEEKFPLGICFCPVCKLVQLNHVVPPEFMFKHYVYVSSTTNTFKIHFSEMAHDICENFSLNDNSLAVDIGSNDGILLKGFQQRGIRFIGVEPAANVAKIAEENGLETINAFFSESVVQEILRMKGAADVVTATNVFAHIDDIDDVMRNVKTLLKKDGVYVIEVQYLVDTIEKMTFDNIYHEHLSYYTLTSLNNFFKKHNMVVFKVQRVDSHGGSLRVFVKKFEGRHEVEDSVSELLEYENKIGINDFSLYEQFATKVYEVKRQFIEYLTHVKKEGKTIAGYGAPAKGNTLLNFCGIGRDVIDFIIEDNPLKVGLYTPGTHIPVVALQALDEKKPDYIVILAWNFAQEILAKTKKYAEQGVKFIIPLPEPVLVE